MAPAWLGQASTKHSQEDARRTFAAVHDTKQATTATL